MQKGWISVSNSADTKYIVTKDELDRVANSIQRKANIEKKINFPEEFINTINNIKTETELDINEIYNMYAGGEFQIDEIVYNRPEFVKPRAFNNLGNTEASENNNVSIYITNATTLPFNYFQYSDLNIVWLGNKDNWEDESTIIPDSKKFVIQNQCFNSSKFSYFIINSNLLPEEALSCGTQAFQSSSFTHGVAAIYVPKNMVNEWIRAIQEDMSITNFEDFVEIYAIEDYFTTGGKLK